MVHLFFIFDHIIYLTCSVQDERQACLKFYISLSLVILGTCMDGINWKIPERVILNFYY